MKKSHTLGTIALLSATLLLSHGNVTPQPVDTKGLAPLGKAWLEANPYVGNSTAIEIGKHAYAENCARCHGLEVVSGGVAPDLRYLDGGVEGDAWFLERIRGGAVRNGNVYMPPFEGVISQEGMWAIRAYLRSVKIDY